MWDEVCTAAEQHYGIIFRHVRSHREKTFAQDLLDGLGPAVYVGNALADVAADIDGKEAEVGWRAAQEVSIIDGDATKLLKKYIDLGIHLAEAPRGKEATKLQKSKN